MMRGVAALSVVFGHLVTMRSNMGISEATANAALGFLQSGVDVFFVISGFIISISASEVAASKGRLGAMGFAVKRAVRIYPVYWVALAASFSSAFFLQIGPAHFPDHISLGIVFLTASENLFMPQAWSMYFEVCFYAMVTVILLIAPKHVPVIPMIGAGSLALAAALGHPLVLEFGFGVGVAYLVKRGFVRLWRSSLILSFAFFATGIFIQIAPGEATLSHVATFGIGSALLIYGVVAGEIHGMVFPATLQYFGKISYSLYVWHFLIFKWLADFAVTPSVPGQIQMMAWLLVVVAASAASYEYIERPIGLIRARSAGHGHAALLARPPGP
jgi:exopolysaccharide production protein ExoZ